MKARKFRLNLIIPISLVMTAIVYMGFIKDSDINTAYADETEIYSQTPSPYVNPSKVSQELPWYIEVDLYNEIVTIYAQDDEGKYTIVVEQCPCTGGGKAYNTESKSPYMFKQIRSSVYKRADYINTRDWGVYGHAEYILQIWKAFLFHSIPYTDASYTIEHDNSYDDITFPASHGCIRLLYQDVRWFYNNIDVGTFCEFTKREPNPELSQMYQPMPVKDDIYVATMPPDYLIRTTLEPEINWDILGKWPKNYVESNFNN